MNRTVSVCMVLAMSAACSDILPDQSGGAQDAVVLVKARNTLDMFYPFRSTGSAIAERTETACNATETEIVCKRCGYSVDLDPSIGLIMEPALLIGKYQIQPDAQEARSFEIEQFGDDEMDVSPVISVEIAQEMSAFGRQWCANRNMPDLVSVAEDYDLIARGAD